MSGYDVVTVSHQNADTITRFLKPWRGDASAAQLWVVDNASNDATVSCLQSLLTSRQYQLNHDNRGYARAANQAAAMGQQAYIAFVNPDCFAGPEVIEPMVQYLKHHDDVGMTGCRVLNSDGSLQPASCRRLPTFWRVFHHLTGLYHLGLPGINKPPKSALQSGPVEAVNGALFVIRRELFTQLNGFDEAYPLHFEDLDLMARCLQAGYQIHYLAEPQAIHLQGQSTQNKSIIQQWKRQGLKRYFKKHRPRWEQWWVNRLLN